ncbi:type VII secretion integral membrane protein EccD [Mycobacterium kansasii 824]|nr:type VII secretion integral membrane protein EccD [Mycobacterium kansasii 824]
MTSPHKVAFPARCAVNICYDKHLSSQVFPAGIPVEGFFEGMVELFDADLKRKGFDGVALPAGSYELHKINGVRLDINKSLDELGVQDGDTLVLVPRVAGESFEPQYESLSTGLAAMGKWLGRDGGDRMFAPVTPLTAAHTAIAIIAMAVGVVVALAVRTRTFTDSLVPAAVAGGIGALLVVGAAVVWWGWRERRDLFSGFGWLAVLLLAVASACAPPGSLGAPHGLIGVVVVLLGAVAIGVVTQKRWQTAVVTAVVTVSGILAVVAVIRMFRPASVQVLAIWVLVGLLVLVRMTPTIALWVARVRPRTSVRSRAATFSRAERGCPSTPCLRSVRPTPRTRTTNSPTSLRAAQRSLLRRAWSMRCR